MNERVLVVAAHPDDEVLGCGGTIAAHAAAGDRVHVVFLADGEGSRDGGDDAAIERRNAMAREAALVLGIEPPRFLGLPDNRVDSVPLLDVIKSVENVVGEVDPTIVYTHHGGDLNIDHRIAYQATITACRPIPGSHVNAIFTFETPSATEWAGQALGERFHATRFVDIREQLPVKMKALALYADELRPAPHPRSPEIVMALARLRGAAAGLEAAEGFAIVRQIVS